MPMQPLLRGLGLENFRVFADYQWFDFAPITILTGPNSSGKSSILKALLLLKDNYEKGHLLEKFTDLKTLPELLFDGDLHDLSSGKAVMNYNSKLPVLNFAFPYRINKIDQKATVVFRYNFSNNLNYVDCFQLIINNNDIIFEYSLEKVYFNFNLFIKLINSANIKNYSTGIGFIGVDLESGSPKKYDTEKRDLLNTLVKGKEWKNSTILHSEIYDKFKKHFINSDEIEEYDEEGYHHVFEGPTYQMSFEQYLNSQDFFRALGYLFAFNYGIIEQEDGIWVPKLNGTIDEIYNTLVFIGESLGIHSAIENVNRFRKNFDLNSLSSIDYLPSLKGRSKRSYQSSEDNTLNLLIKEFLNKENLSDKNKMHKPYHELYFKKWKNQFKIDDISIHRNEMLDIYYLTVGNKSISEVGFGFSQLTAILLKLAPWTVSTNRYRGKSNILLIEEPESNLHPKFQSLLADMFLDALKQLEHQFIIETHSEYMIRKFQYLVAKGEMKPEDIVIYYLHDPNEIPKGEKQVKKIEILPDGSLSDDFGPGFFDEATNWKFELLRLKNSQKN